MNRTYCAMALFLGLLSIVPIAAHAGIEGRIAGKVLDPEEKPVAGARITVRALDIDYSTDAESNDKGKFTMVVLDATKRYVLRIEAPGYMPLEEPIELEVGGLVRRQWILYPEGSGGPSEEEMARIESHNRVARIYNEAAAQFDRGELDAALAGMDAALAESPDLALALSAKTRIHLELADGAAEEASKGHLESALTTARRFRELYPEEPFGPRAEFDALLALGHEEEATELLEKLAAEEGGMATAVRYFDLGVRAIRAQQLDRAKAAFTRVLELQPDLKEAHLNLALIGEAEGDDAAVIVHTDRYLELDPGESRALTMKYEAHQALGQKEQADQAFARLKASDPQGVADAFLREGTELWNQGQTATAIEKFQRVLQIAPEHPRAHYQLGLCYLSAGELDPAKRHLNRFLELAPDDPEAEMARQMLASI